MGRHSMAEHTRYERLYGLFLAYAALLALFGLTLDTPAGILRGLSTIILTEDAPVSYTHLIPVSIRAAATRWVLAEVFPYTKQPQSVDTATYRGRAMSAVTGPSCRRMSYINSPQAARPASRQVSRAKNSWDGWWSMARSTRGR